MRTLAFFFFFQAEDGIRDYKVTGVQTCALPILIGRMELPRHPLPIRPEVSGMGIVDDAVCVESRHYGLVGFWIGVRFVGFLCLGKRRKGCGFLFGGEGGSDLRRGCVYLIFAMAQP